MSERVKGFPAFGKGVRHARSWWGRAWLKALEDTSLDQAPLRQGRKYAHAGLVGTITVSPGRLDAVVHDPDDTYRTTVRLTPLTDAEWRRFLDRVAGKAGHLAALLDHEVPRDLVDAAADAGVPLLPGIGDLDPECTCPGWELPCRHAAALCHQASWLLDADPWVLLLLRGRDRDEVVAGARPTTTGT
ncbi:SWIM zinc finger family protein, partial [Saccharothrix longispora]|uniref:SWIM zinc finger family protein n=1 Tax=Saccharothrix longispora TaxID=33920 RepID=UPI0028FD9151